MYFEDEEQLPVLLPIRKKKNEVLVNEGNSERASNNQETLSIFPGKQNVVQPVKDTKKAEQEVKPIAGAQKTQEFEKKFRNVHEMSDKKQEKERKKINNREKEMEKSKYLISEMMKKIDAKNISEELYPVTNETIAELIRKMDGEIDGLKDDAQRKENSLSSNPNNQHLKKEIEGLKSSIDRCVTIKQLYNEKINLRNKISILQSNVINLKEENTNLKIKINRGIETISNHMHNLPCEKEKQLKEELNKCQLELKIEKEMRIKLESNISDIVLNFKRLYEEADTARLIITKKLKELQEKEKKISEYQPANVEKDNPVSEKRSPQIEALEEKKLKKYHQNSTQEMNGETRNKSGLYSPFSHTPISLEQNKSKQRARETEKVTVSAFSMQEQIRKMRSNQATLSKGQYK